MRTTIRACLAWAPAALLVAALSAWLGLRGGFAFTDYDSEASHSVALLLGGDVGGFLDAAPAYGGSLALRAPALLVTGVLGGGDAGAFRALAAAGLLALAALACGLAAAARRRGWSRGAALAVLGLALLARPTLEALEFGHAEELLGAALSVGAVVAAQRGRWALAGLLVGLAVANKPWAVVVVPVVLVTLTSGRLRAAALAGIAAACVLAPFWLAGSGAATAAGVATSAGTVAKPFQLWWFAGQRRPVLPGASAARTPRNPPALGSRASRAMIVLAALALCALWARRRARAAGPLGLLALVLLARCLLDPWTTVYYHAPFLLALLAWEVRAGRARWPLATLLAAGALQALDLAAGALSMDGTALAYLAVALPGLAALALAVYAPERARALLRRAAAAPRRARARAVLPAAG